MMNTESSSQAGGPRGGSASDQTAVDSNGSAAAVEVVLAAPDAMVRSELRARLERHGGFVVAAEKINATQALGATLFHSPRVCLLAIDLPGDLDGRIKSIRTERPDTRIGILARSADQPGLLHAVLAGADGVLLTSDSPETFVAELGALARGERVLPAEEGEAPSPEEGEALPAEEGEALPPEEGEAPSPEEGEALPAEEGEALPAEGGEALAPEAAQTSRPEGAEDAETLPVEEGEAPAAPVPAAEIGEGHAVVPSGEPEPFAEAPALVAAQPRDSWLKATVLYVPRFFHHLRRRLRARMPLPIAWSSARERMWDYR